MQSELVSQSRVNRTVILAACLLFSSASAWSQALNACDLNADGVVNVIDVQLAINMDLGLSTCIADIEGAGICNSDVVSRVTTAALGSACVVTVSHSATLNWTASTSSNVSGYNIYRSATSGGSYTKLNTSLVAAITYADTTVAAGQTYYFVVTAVDGSGNESVYSNQVQAIIPTP
jgi:fibronectin type 3 domain-containing protein